MKKLFLLFTIISIPFLMASAQQLKLEHDVAEDTIARKFGPNLRHYAHFYAGIGLVAGPSENASSQVRYPASHEVVGGIRYKYKVGEVYALGLEVGTSLQIFKLRQKAAKQLPDTVLHDMEKLQFFNLGLGFYNRFNWDKRGNYVGNFLDLGVYGNWMLSSVHIHQDNIKGGSPSGVETIRIRESGLNYVEDFNYGFLARLGFNRYVFYGTYRLSDLFDNAYVYRNGDFVKTFKFAELPRYTLGFQLSLHK
jgi:hypothetical protein